MRVGVRVRREIGRFEMDYVLWLCHYHSTGVSGCFGLFFSFFFFLFEAQCCVSNGGFFRYLLSTLVLMIPSAGELVGVILHSLFPRFINAVVVSDCSVGH